MTYIEAKQIRITDILSLMGHKSVKLTGSSSWYLSPYRNEKTPSFKVDLNKNLWYDFGEGKGGNVIKLVALLYRESEQDAFARLTRMYRVPQTISIKNILQQPSVPENKIIITRNQKIQSPALISYLSSRRIQLNYAAPFLREIHYKVGKYDKVYFALGLKNDMEGFELRCRVKDRDYKRCAGTKYYSTVFRTDSGQLDLFEGMFDFLSALVYYQSFPSHTCIVMNSVNTISQVVPLLKDYKKINLYLDNDDAGRRTVEKVMEHHSNCIDYSQLIYTEFKDFNEFLCE